MQYITMEAPKAIKTRVMVAMASKILIKMRILAAVTKTKMTVLKIIPVARTRLLVNLKLDWPKFGGF